MARILVIDDEPTMLSYLERILRLLNYDVVTATNSTEGCAKAADSGVDLILSDLAMPGELSDVSLIRRLKELRPDCPIVVISGYPTSERLDECRKLGVCDFLTKPFELAFVSGVLKRLLDEKAAGDASGASE